MKNVGMKKQMRKGRSDRRLELFVKIVMVVYMIIIMYPLIYVVSSSFSSGSAVSAGRVVLWPVDFSLDGYKMVFKHKGVWTGYKNTLIYTFAGTFINLILTILAAYPLSRRNFQGRNIYMAFFVITMFFSGGIIPSYLLISKLGLLNTRWAILLSGSVAAYYVIIMRTFFQNSIPDELHDAAMVDGITDIGYLLKVVLPLSKAVIAVVTLYYAVGQWNAYFSALMYVRKSELHPLQLVLRGVLASAEIDMQQITGASDIVNKIGIADVMKYSLIVVSTVPILVIYPFVQKFFEKGVMIGSVKG